MSLPAGGSPHSTGHLITVNEFNNSLVLPYLIVLEKILHKDGQCTVIRSVSERTALRIQPSKLLKKKYCA